MIDEESKLLIKDMVEKGFANKRISTKLKLQLEEVNDLIKSNNWILINESFDDSKIDYVCNLYEQGISAKCLGKKFSMDKRRIQRWAKGRGFLRTKSDSHRFVEFNQNIFDIIDTPEKAYWLGFFYADAYNGDRANTFSINLAIVDYDHLVKLAKFIELPVEKVGRYQSFIDDKTFPTCNLKMYSKHICEKMTELGCHRAKSFTIKYPEWMPKKLNKHFIRGMFDGDGCITYRANHKEWKWSLVSTKECCESINKILLDQVGFSISFENISKTNNNTYCFSQSGNEKILKIMDWLYKKSDVSMRLDRKYKKYLDLIDHQNNRKFTKNFNRKKYNISETDKAGILKEIIAGEKLVKIAKTYNVHPKTVYKIKENMIAEPVIDNVIS